MPGWLSRAAAWASRSTRRTGVAARFDRLDRDRALEAPVPGLVDAPKPPLPMRRSIRKRLRTREPTTALSDFAANPLPPATYSLLLGGFARIPAGAPAAPAASPRTAADPAAARPRARRRPAAPDPDRARRQGLPRRPQAPGAQRLRPQRHPDRRRDRPDQQVLLRQARRTRQPLGDRVRQPRSTPTAARWTTTPAGSTASSAPGDMSNAQNALELVYELRGSAMNEIAEKMSTALGDVGAEKATESIADADAQAARQRRRSTRRSSRPEIDGVLADNGIEGDDVPKSVFLPDGTTGSTKARSARRSARSAARAAASTAGRPRPRPDRHQHQRHRTDRRIDHRGRQRRNAGSRSRSAEPGRIDRERRSPSRSPSAAATPCSGTIEQHRRRRNGNRRDPADAGAEQAK